MECACFSVDNGDYVIVLATNRRKARKLHRCNECRGAIFPGQTYIEERYLFEGTVSTHKTCLCCGSIRDNLFCGHTYSQLWDDLEDFLGESIDSVPWGQIAKLTPAAKAHVLLLIEEIWTDNFYEEDDL